MEHYDLKISDAADYAFEISIGERYGAIIYKIESIEEGATMVALKIYLSALQAEATQINQRLYPID